jgi:DNA-binding NarL/FixJ family response regulator
VDQHIEVVGSTRSSHEALEEVSRLRPDLVLMDIVMSGMSGLEAAWQIKAQSDAPRVVLLMLYDDIAYHDEAENIHADGFVSKSEAGVNLLSVTYRLFAV